MKGEGLYGLEVDIWELLHAAVGLLVECRKIWSELVNSTPRHIRWRCPALVFTVAHESESSTPRLTETRNFHKLESIRQRKTCLSLPTYPYHLL